MTSLSPRNADETFVSYKPGKKKLITFSSEYENSPDSIQRPFIQMVPKESEHITLMGCIFADDTSMAPLLMLPLETMPALPKGFHPGTYVTGTDKGWVTTEAFEIWSHLFVKEIAQRRQELPAGANPRALLVLDGHITHHQPERKAFLSDNQIDVWFIPPHSYD